MVPPTPSSGSVRGRHWLLSRKKRQLRRLDAWAALADVAFSSVADIHSAGRGSTVAKPRGTLRRTALPGGLGSFRSLLALESLAASLDLRPDDGMRLAGLLTSHLVGFSALAVDSRLKRVLKRQKSLAARSLRSRR